MGSAQGKEDSDEIKGTADSEERKAEKSEVIELHASKRRTDGFVDFVHTLEKEQHASPRSKGKKRDACGFGDLGCGAGRDKVETAREFSKMIQDMIKKLLSQPRTVRMRVFDNHTVHFDVEDGVMATFEECRSTQFRRLRAAAGLTEQDYISSMCDKPFLGGDTENSGKSGSLFLRSHDNRFVLKTVEQHEFDALYEILPNYVLYLEENVNSLLCRFVGAYSLTLENITLRLVVMANVLPDRPDEVYDLKGTTEDRWVDPMQGGCLKDNNFQLNTMLFEATERQLLLDAITDDAEFLEQLGLMDYSLLVGIATPKEDQPSTSWLGGSTSDPHTRKVAYGHLQTIGEEKPAPRIFQMGIIDYLQKWTPKKVAAHWLKKPTIGFCFEIDTEPPGVYSGRFIKYFLLKLGSRASTTSAIHNGY